MIKTEPEEIQTLAAACHNRTQVSACVPVSWNLHLQIGSFRESPDCRYKLEGPLHSNLNSKDLYPSEEPEQAHGGILHWLDHETALMTVNQGQPL